MLNALLLIESLILEADQISELSMGQWLHRVDGHAGNNGAWKSHIARAGETMNRAEAANLQRSIPGSILCRVSTTSVGGRVKCGPKKTFYDVMTRVEVQN